MTENTSIMKSLAFLHPLLGLDDQVVELCIIAPGAYPTTKLWTGRVGGKSGIAAGFFDKLDALEFQAMDVDAGWTDPKQPGGAGYPQGVYVTANPVSSALLGRAANRLVGGISRTSDQDVEKITTIFVDIDPIRPAGVSATDKQKKQAQAVAKEVRQTLMDEFNWPEPGVADSGNGYHLLWKTDLPNEPSFVAMLKSLLVSLDSRHSTKAVSIDTTTYNPSRLIRLHGTMARKGDSTTAQPHRKSKWLKTPAHISYVTVPQIEAVINQEDTNSPIPVDKPKKKTSDFQDTPVARLDVPRYLEHHNYFLLGEKQIGDSTLYLLNCCIFDPNHSDGEAAIGQTKDGKLFYKCFHNSCQDHTWAEARKIISGDAPITPFIVGGNQGPVVSFPECTKAGLPKNRVTNLQAICAAYHINIRKNLMTREFEYDFGSGLAIGDTANVEDVQNYAISTLLDLCRKHSMSVTNIMDWIALMGERTAYHPIRDWINEAQWDGVSRIAELEATVTPAKGFAQMWSTYLRRWLIQAIATLYQPGETMARSVLVLQGNQGIGKTTWIKHLVPSNLHAVKDGLMLNPADSDSVMAALRYWIVELGELGSTFRRADIDRLKAFLSNTTDILRLPYARTHVKLKRQTVFAGSVNDVRFLNDSTGNSRWWVVPVDAINYNHSVDMRQLWAEVKTLWASGEQWHLNTTEARLQEFQTSRFEHQDPIVDSLFAMYDFDVDPEFWVWPQSLREVAETIGTYAPKPNQMRVLSNVLAAQKVVEKRRGARVLLLMPPRRSTDQDDERPLRIVK